MKSISPSLPDSNRLVIRIASIALVGCMLLAIVIVVLSSKTSSVAGQPPAFPQSRR